MEAVSSKLENLASDAASIEKEAGGFMQPGEKRRRGRPRKDPNAPPKEQAQPNPQVKDPIPEIKTLTKPVVGLYSNVLVMYAEDEKAALNDQVQEALSETSAQCLHQYFPDTFGKHTALIVLTLTVGSTFLNAWRIRKENIEKMKEEKAHRESMNGHAKGGPSLFVS